MEKDIKQVIVMRKDLNMRKGKMIAQGSHASMGIFFELLRKKYFPADKSIVYEMHLPPGELGNDIATWVEGIFKKVVCGIDSEEGLLKIYEAAKEKGLPCKLIKDAGLTEFGGVPTYTCCAIGPADSVLVDEITSTLSLL